MLRDRAASLTVPMGVLCGPSAARRYGIVVFPDIRLVVEFDGRAWHSADDRFQHDRDRQNRLVPAGWAVLRFTWRDLDERPSHVIDTIQRMCRRLAARVA